MTAPPIVVFDLDGTLAETAGDLIGTLNVILAREGLPPVSLDQAREMIGAGAKAMIQRGFSAAGAPLPPERLDALFVDFLAHYGEHLLDKTHLYPGVTEALDALRERGYRLAICTNKVERHAVDLMRLMGLADRFAAICGRETFAWFKPDGRHITETIRMAGGDSARAVMVGDSKSDVDAARDAGIPVIGVPFGYTDIPIDDLDPDRVITHYDALVEAVESVLERASARPAA